MSTNTSHQSPILTVEKHVDNKAGVALIRLQRPKVLNALSHETIESLAMALLELDADSEIKCIILTGDEKAFAAGADLSELVEASSMDQLFHTRERMLRIIDQVKTPMIAAVSGYALGGGLELAMACDIIIAADNAQFGQPEIKVGTMPGAGGTQRLTKAIGKSKAMMMCLSGDMIDAQKAYEWNLVAKVVPRKSLLSETLNMACKISSHSAVSARLIKESINKSFETPLSQGLDFERRNYYLGFSSHDREEGMRAFLEKRKPEYRNK